MKKPQRTRIPLRPAPKADGEERAYTSNYGDPKPSGERKERTFPARESGDGAPARKPYARKEGGDNKRPFEGRKPYGDKPFEKREGNFKKPYVKREGAEGDRPFKERKPYGDKPFVKREGASEDRPFRERKPYGDKPFVKREGASEDRPFRERKPYGDKPFEKRAGAEGDRPFRDKKPYGDKPFAKREGTGEDRPFKERKPYGDKPFEKREGGFKKPYSSREGDSRDRKSFEGGAERKPFVKREGFSKREEGDTKSPYPGKSFGDRKPFTPRDNSGEKKPFNKEKSFGPREGGERSSFRDKKPFDRKERPRKDAEESTGKPRRRTFREGSEKPVAEGTGMTLNKYLSHSGICGRREAGEIVKSGKVTVNGEVLTTPGYRVQPSDIVTYEGRVVKPEAAKVYVLLNKPKGFITTTEDEAERHTVMELVQSVEAERLYPVGRLDRNTTGVLLLTNDGDLAQRLTHPKYECKKIYQVTLDKDVTKADLEKLATGITLEDGEIKADEVAYLETKKEIGIEIHSGRNRIVRRMFEHLGYTVEKLDRVMFAGLTKKNVSRGKYRLLTEKEVILLKHFKG